MIFTHHHFAAINLQTHELHQMPAAPAADTL
jgi:hypothetical protein